MTRWMSASEKFRCSARFLRTPGIVIVDPAKFGEPGRRATPVFVHLDGQAGDAVQAGTQSAGGNGVGNHDGAVQPHGVQVVAQGRKIPRGRRPG